MSGERRARLSRRLPREFGVDRKTVRSCLRQATWTPYRREAGIATVLDAHRAWIVERAPQVITRRASCTRNCAASGASRAVTKPSSSRFARCAQKRRSCRPHATPVRKVRANKPRSTGQVTVSFGGQRSKVHIFVMTLIFAAAGATPKASRASAFPTCWLPSERAFSPTSVAAASSCSTIACAPSSSARRPTSTASARRNSTPPSPPSRPLGFHAEAVSALPGPDQGKVESGVKYVKRNFVPGRSFADLDDFTGNWRSGRSRLPTFGSRRPTSDRSTVLPTKWPHWCPRPAGQLPASHGPLAGRRRRLAGVDRRQPLLGTFRSDRPVRRGRACRRPLADPPSRATGRRTSGTGGPRTAVGMSRARSRRRRAQRPATLPALPPGHGIAAIRAHEVEVRDLAIYDTLLQHGSLNLEPGEIVMAKTTTKPAAGSAVTTPAQLERLGEHLHKAALAEECRASGSHAATRCGRGSALCRLSSRCSARRWRRRRRRTCRCARRWRASPSSSRWRPSTRTSPRSTSAKSRRWRAAITSSTATT